MAGTDAGFDWGTTSARCWIGVPEMTAEGRGAAGFSTDGSGRTRRGVTTITRSTEPLPKASGLGAPGEDAAGLGSGWSVDWDGSTAFAAAQVTSAHAATSAKLQVRLERFSRRSSVD